MNIQIRSLGLVALMMATSAAYADARVSVDINPFGWGAPPPPVVYYSPPSEYVSPPVVYYGRGHWGDRREGHDRDHGRDHDRGRSDHHDGGDRR